MATPVLATKLFVPPPRPDSVARPRLLKSLTGGRAADRRLTLVSAPAGFGKTTLLSEWIAETRSSDPQLRVAWLSLDDGDNALPRFLAHLLAALSRADPAIGAEAATMLDGPEWEPALVALVNDLAASPDRFLLVLDDYHVLDSRTVHDVLAFLLDHAPAQLRIAIATRSDPPLPLSRLRARDELTEIRAADLRFTPAEAAGLLNDVMGLALPPGQVDALEARTEGWIAGLQLAALSLRGRDDASSFIESFTGSSRFVLDYLVEEVLERQPDPVRSFLLRTAILDRLSGPLCDAVTGQTGGSAMLAALDRANLFVVPLDDRREWYRYHHLFAEVLRSRGTAEEPADVAALHRRASEWYERNGFSEDAVDHAFAARDFERAALLLEAALPAMRRSRQEDAVLIGWLTRMPSDVVRRSPVLSAFSAWTMLVAGDLEAAEHRLEDAERGLRAAAGSGAGDPSAGVPIRSPDGEEYRRLPMTIAGYRAALAQARGDIAGIVASARDVLDLAAPDDHLPRASALGFLGLAAWSKGDLDTAVPTFSAAVESLHAAGNLADELGSTLALADMHVARGQLRRARELYERALSAAAASPGPIPRATADLHVGISELDTEAGFLDLAREHLEISEALGERAAMTEHRSRGPAAMAGILQAEGDLDGAIASLEEAERLHRPGFVPDVRPIAARRARLRIAQGRLSDALAWADAAGLSAGDEVSYLKEYEHLTLARLLLAQHALASSGDSADDALRLLGRLLEAADASGRGGSVNEILVVQSLAHEAAGRRAPALEVLQRVLARTAPEGYLRLFLDEGAPMADLLRAATRAQIAPDAVARLLGASSSADRAPGPRPATPEASGISLSERELQVLRLLETDLTGPEMARALFVTVNTLRTHIKHIFTKLEVSSRATALRRARERGLL
jgi:LuxR family maltose regulon positive regulatory protein